MTLQRAARTAVSPVIFWKTSLSVTIAPAPAPPGVSSPLSPPPPGVTASRTTICSDEARGTFLMGAWKGEPAEAALSCHITSHHITLQRF